MMKKYLLAILGLVILCFGLVGCEETEPTAPSTTSVDTRLVNLEVWKVGVDGNISTLTNTMANKAETSTVTAISNRVGALEGQSAANTYPKTQLYTQAEVDALIQALKDDQSWITGRTPTGTTTGDYGELVDTDGDLELWLDRVSGDASDILRTKVGSNSARFDLVVVNTDASESHDFKIDIEFEPDTNVALVNYNPTTCGSGHTCVSASGYLKFLVSRTDEVRSSLRIEQTNTGRITKGDVEDYTIQIYVEQGTGDWIDWEYYLNIRDRG